MKRPLQVKPLSEQAFAPYGKVLRRDLEGELFQPLHTETQHEGWRVAILQIQPGPLARIHRHPDSEECFSPLTGSPCIAVAEAHEPESICIFQLSEPVCVNRNVWHELVADVTATVFIAENALISGESLPQDPAVHWKNQKEINLTKTDL